MKATLEFFPVGNGDMTLVTLASGRRILIDMNILSHPDRDHCSGLERHFHLGAEDTWNENDDKIIIHEMWSSPIVFRRKRDVEGSLVADADAWWKEARRRVTLYKNTGDKEGITLGNLIQVLGEDRDDKTDDIQDILIREGELFSRICREQDETFVARLLAPHYVSEEEAKELTGKNHSSVVIAFELTSENRQRAGLFLTGGDAEVENWERIWGRNSDTPDKLQYNVLQAPHHCSWHSLSYDKYSDLGERAVVSQDARNALSQALPNSLIVASSKAIDTDNPSKERSRREYQSILEEKSGAEFICTGNDSENDVLLIEFDEDGPLQGTNGRGSAFLTSSAGTPPRKVGKTDTRYA